MFEQGCKIDPASRGLDHSPAVRSAVVEVARPSLRDNTGLSDRICRAAARELGLEAVEAGPETARGAASILEEAGFRVRVAVSVDGRRGRLVSVRPADAGPACGLAVDVGSTTLVLALVDLAAPAIIDRLTLPNPQVEYGDDILTRIHYSERPGQADVLTEALRDGVNRGLAELCRRNGLTGGDIAAGCAAGNTAMTHFLLGLPCRTLIREPYVPVMNRFDGLTAGDLGINIPAPAPFLVMPNKGAYFGGDLIAGLTAAGMGRSDELCLLVDVGTNAEVVLGQGDWLIGAAGAAGPALEGGVAARGMAAAPGAVDRVRIDRETWELSYRTLEGALPRGLCGSGLIDLFAEMYLSGIIDFRGKLTLPEDHPRRAWTDEGPAFVVIPGDETETGEPILLSEVELDILTRSKAAMYTIITTVLLSVGVEAADLDRFYMAGTFGQYIDPKMAVALGMAPDIPLDRFTALGNSSLDGAVLALVSDRARDEALDVWSRLTYLEMNVNQELMNRFSAARFIPHTDRERFPSVGAVIT